MTLLREVVFKMKDGYAENIAGELMECARLANKESLLALEQRSKTLSHDFAKNTIRSVSDGVDAKSFEDIMTTIINVAEAKLSRGAKVWTDAGGYAPTIGILGAVLGLIHVMGNLRDTSKLGSGIAVAFVATIYGVGFANLLFLPIGQRIKRYVQDETVIKQMILTGALGILQGHSVAVIDQSIRAHLDRKI